MKKYRIILTKNGEVYINHKYTHESIVDSHKVQGRDWHDWVRVVIDGEGKLQMKGETFVTKPEWLERQYAYYMNLVKDELKKYRRVKKC